MSAEVRTRMSIGEGKGSDGRRGRRSEKLAYVYPNKDPKSHLLPTVIGDEPSARIERIAQFIRTLG